MAGERLDFDIFARLREDGFAKAAKAAGGASDEVLKLAGQLDKLGAKSTKARVGLEGDKEALAQLDKLQLKMLKVGGQLIDPKIDLKGTAKAQAELAALDASMDKLDGKSKGLAASLGLSGLSGPSGMGALIGAGAALSPILTTVAFGVGGFGLAAAGAVAPVLKAAQATGGLRANMAKLDPEQQKLAQSVLGLGQQYHAFSASLQPQVLAVFGKGIEIAGHLMHDIQPVAAATGKALGSMLDAIDKEFQGGTWQKFFAFMAKTAGPDIALITSNFTDLLDVLPGLMQDMQPLATAFLTLTDAGLKVVGFLGKIRILLPIITAGIGAFLGGPVGALIGAFVGIGAEVAGTGGKLTEFDRVIADVHARMAVLSAVTNVASGISQAHAAAVAAETKSVQDQLHPVFNLSAAVKGLTDAMARNVSEILILQGDEIGWQQSLQAAEKQLESNSAGLRGNSKDALANKAAVLQSTQAAVSFADEQLTAGKNVRGASQDIQAQIRFLQEHGGKSAFARREIHALRMEEDKLKATIRNRILVSAEGFWKVTGALLGGVPQSGTGPHPRAARGMYVSQGAPGVDDQLILAQKHELVVPVPIVKAGLVDHLRGMIPGFDSGGVVGNYSGSVGGMPKWLAAEDSATLHAVAAATAAATAAGIKGAQAAAGGGAGAPPGSTGPGAAAAQSWMHAHLGSYGWGNSVWPSLVNLWNGESGWNALALNTSRPGNTPYNAAYGIPQSDPGSKMASMGGDWLTNGVTQMRWGASYIRSVYGNPATAYSDWLGRSPHWYAKGGPVGGKAVPQDPQRKAWLAQLERDVTVLTADEKNAAKRRKVLNRSLAIDELWFLTHPHVKKGGIGWNEEKKALDRDRAMLRHFNRTEGARETVLRKKIALLRELTGFPRALKYGGPGPAAGGTGDGTGAGDAGGTGGPVTPPAPPPIPPPPMPSWMVAAGLGGGTATAATFATARPAMAWPEPATFGGGAPAGWGSQGGAGIAGQLQELIRLTSQVHQAVQTVAPRTARGFDQSMNSTAARIASRFS